MNQFPKQFKSLSDQRDILMNKHLLNQKVIEDELLKKNYFDLVNGLEDIINTPSQNSKCFSNYTFNDLLGLYELNKEIRELLFSVIGEFEVKLKSSIAYHFSDKYRSWNSYTDPNNYKNVTIDDRYEVFLARFGYSPYFEGSDPVINQYKLFPFFRSNELLTKFYRKKRYLGAYGGHPPLWVAIKALNFGELHILFSMLQSPIAEEVLNDFNLKLADRNLFESVLDVVNWLRNECAHFEMINNSRYHGKYPLDEKLITKLGIETNKSRMNLNLFSSMQVLDFIQEFKQRFNDLINNFSLSPTLKKKYLMSIGYQVNSGWKTV
ncbi:Abi family protein [Ligilactobacillus aviarius]|uniref:Abi family protein n=1 Tax=Ligilactobacillus aviarius TaxID=1606 RepID=UPI0024BB382E|nr:Abi family protein [Ligilactobacillus aviarius]